MTIAELRDQLLQMLAEKGPNGRVLLKGKNGRLYEVDSIEENEPPGSGFTLKAKPEPIDG